MPEPVLTPLPYAPHGGPEGGPDGSARKLLDFSVNSNPFGPPPELLDFLRGVDVSSYPDPTGAAARGAAAEFHGVSPDQIVLGGAAELIYRLSACYLKPGRRVLIASPTFGEYARAARLYGAELRTCDVYGKNRRPNIHAFTHAVAQGQPTLVWLCGPNNPTGHAWSAEALAEVAAACERHDALLVIDAAYLELSRATQTLPDEAVKLFPLTKTFHIAGLRAGYALAPPGVAEVLRRTAPPWPVSAPAEAAVRWCRSEAGRAFIEKTVPELLAQRRAFGSGLCALGFEVWASSTSFFLAEVEDVRAFATRAREAGFRVRDASSFGLPGCIRLAARTQGDNEAFLRWLAC